MNRTRGGIMQQRAAAQRRYAPSETGMDESVASEVGSAAPVNELFQAIKLGQSLQVAVDNWIAGYKEDANEALCELLNLLMIVSGCRGQITVDHLAVESTVVIQQLTEQFDEDSGEYPFMSNGQHARRLRANFADFLLIFMRQIQHSIVFDEFLVENFLNFVIALTDSQVRAFRHTSTFAAMKILTGLVESSLQLRTNLEHAKKQHEAERARVEGSRRGGVIANERLSSLREKCDELEKQSKVLNDFQATLFKGVFVHRYRDTLTDIRVLCMHEIGTWIRRAPFTYLDDAYLKYVGWTLYDKVAEVRLECLRTLIALYENAAFVSRLELFTNRFRERLVEMTSDREPEVALHAVKLLRLIHQRTPDLLPDKDCEAVFELIFSANRALAQAAGDFLNQKLFARVRPATAAEEESPALTANYADRHYSADDYRRVLRQTVAFFNEAEMHEHAAYLVDALLERNTALKQWRIATGMLLSDADADQTDADLGVDGGLSTKEEAVLIDMMVCTVRQACTGEAPVGRGPQSAGTTVQKRAQKEQKALQEERRRMTEHFIVALPNLLARFLTDSEKLANLLQIPTYMQLDLYVTNRQERYLDQLLKLLCEVVEKHQEDEVLLRTARIFELLANRYRSNSSDADADDPDGVPFVSESHAHKVNVVLGNLLDKLTQRFATASNTYVAAIEDADADEHDESTLVNESVSTEEMLGSSVAYQTLSALRKLVAFFQLHDLNARGLWDSFAALVERNLQKPSLGATSFEIVKRALNGMASALEWGVLYFETAASRASGEQLLREHDDADAPSRRPPVKFNTNEQAELRRLGERVRTYFAAVHTLLERHAGGRIEQLEETLSLTSDLLVLFSRNLLDLNAPDVAVHLVFTPADDFLSAYVRRVEQFVFVPRDGATSKRPGNQQPGAAGDEEIDAAKLDALHKRRNVLAALAKLVIFNLVPQRAAVGMFARYAAYYNDYGDLIRTTLVKSRELSRELHAEALAEALQLAFRRPPAPGVTGASVPLFIERASTQFAALKELSKKLALSFGSDLHRNKDTVRRIHEHSIRFMFDTYRTEKTAFDAHVQAQAQADAGQLAPRGRPHPHHVFLLAEPLLEFASRLVGPDKKTVFLVLEQQLNAHAIDLRNRPDAFWQALNSYRSSLAVDGSLLQQAAQPAAPRTTVQLATTAAAATIAAPVTMDMNMTNTSVLGTAQATAQFKVPATTAQPVQTAVKRRVDADNSAAATAVATSQNVVVTVKRPRHDAEGGPVATSQIIVANQSTATPTAQPVRAAQYPRQ